MALSESTKRYRKQRNLCPRCGQPNIKDRKMCKKHLKQYADKQNKRNKTLAVQSKEQGLCTRCFKKKADEGFSYCSGCREYSQKHSDEKNKIKREKCKKEGLCLECMKFIGIGKSRCTDCLKKTTSLKNIRQKGYKDNGLCHTCGKNLTVDDGKRCQECINKRNEWYETSDTKEKNRQDRILWKDTVLEHYGRSCGCCGESTLEFLTLDHIQDNGGQHRKEINKYGSGFYKWVIDNNFPEDLQTLCMNCNFGKRINGGICPHQQKGNES